MFFLLSLGEDKVKALRETFLEVEETETLFEEYLAIQQVWSFFFKYTCLLALELALEGKLDEFPDSPTY